MKTITSSSNPASMHWRATSAPKTLTYLAPAASFAAVTASLKSPINVVLVSCASDSGDEAIERHRGRVQELAHLSPLCTSPAGSSTARKASDEGSASGQRCTTFEGRECLPASRSLMGWLSNPETVAAILSLRSILAVNKGRRSSQ